MPGGPHNGLSVNASSVRGDPIFRALFIAFIVIDIAFVAGLLMMNRIGWQADFHKEPPVTIYRSVFAHDPPEGVTDIRASGRHYFMKQWAWLRFRATDSALKTLIADNEPLSPEDTRRLTLARFSANSRYDAFDRAWVGWGSKDIPSGDWKAYEFFRGDTSTWMWHIQMFVDRKRHLVLVRALGD